MKRGLGIFLAWAGATIVAVVVAAAAVGSVRTEITDAPTAIGTPIVVAIAADTTGETTIAPSPPPTVPPQGDRIDDVVTDDQGHGLTDDGPNTTSTTSAAPKPTTPTTSVPVPEPTTTISTPESFSKTYDTEGGSVRVVVTGDAVTFGGAVPNPGWRVELNDDGPEKVEVHFESNGDEDEEVEFRATLKNGELVVSIKTGEGEGHGEDEGDD